MPQSSPLSVGRDVHQDSSAGADVAQAPNAAVISLGTVGTRPADSDQLVPQLPSTAPHLVVVYEAGHCGYWLYRYLMTKGHHCAGSWRPHGFPTKPATA